MSETPTPEPFRFFALTLQAVSEKLSAGWVFDPWLCLKGYPVMTGEDACYWVLVRPEALDRAEANPFRPLPVEEERPAGYGTVFVPHRSGEDATREWAERGYVLLHKDHADVVGPDKVKGTLLTLTRKPEEAGKVG